MGEGNDLVSQSGLAFAAIWLKVPSSEEQISIWSGRQNKNNNANKRLLAPKLNGNPAAAP